MTNYTYDSYGGVNKYWPLCSPLNWTVNDENNNQYSYNSDILNNYRVIHTFPYIPKNDIAATRIKFTQIGMNSRGDYHFCLHKIEIFGFLYIDNKIISCNTYSAIKISLLIMVIFISII